MALPESLGRLGGRDMEMSPSESPESEEEESSSWRGGAMAGAVMVKVMIGSGLWLVR